MPAGAAGNARQCGVDTASPGATPGMVTARICIQYSRRRLRRCLDDPFTWRWKDTSRSIGCAALIKGGFKGHLTINLNDIFATSLRDSTHESVAWPHPRKIPDEIFGELVGILYHSPQSVLCVLICAIVSAFYVAVHVDHWTAWTAAGVACGACAYRGWWLFAYQYRGKFLPGFSESGKWARRYWARRYGIGTVAQNLAMTSVIILAFCRYPSLDAAAYGWAMATAIGSLSMTAGVLWIPVLGSITLMAPIGVAALLRPSLDAKLCGAFALINMYAAIECAKYLHSSFVSRLIAERDASHQASPDPLTGLYNRRMLDARLNEACATGGPVSLLALDLDGFKPVNDTLDHAAGDEVLRQAASRLRALVGDEGLVVRAGGDEGLVLVHGPTRARHGVDHRGSPLRAVCVPAAQRQHRRVGRPGPGHGRGSDATAP